MQSGKSCKTARFPTSTSGFGIFTPTRPHFLAFSSADTAKKWFKASRRVAGLHLPLLEHVGPGGEGGDEGGDEDDAEDAGAATEPGWTVKVSARDDGTSILYTVIACFHHTSVGTYRVTNRFLYAALLDIHKQVDRLTGIRTVQKRRARSGPSKHSSIIPPPPNPFQICSTASPRALHAHQVSQL